MTLRELVRELRKANPESVDLPFHVSVGKCSNGTDYILDFSQMNWRITKFEDTGEQKMLIVDMDLPAAIGDALTELHWTSDTPRKQDNSRWN